MIHSRFFLVVCLVVLCVLASAAFADGDVKPKRPAPTGLLIGIKKRVAAEDCKIKTQRGDRVTMHYRGTLYDTGEQFDASYDRADPFKFVLGAGQVIKGWDQGLVGMCVGEKRKLTIPAPLAYGDRATGKIPAGATLVFETELLDIARSDNSQPGARHIDL
ncbi:peptidyl-prolyl cis-trans isomerase FKBP2-like protein [Phlyctochytrium arcticum]|nr:peptidyl-prolyl cis-trans isomerase FKBP2-like protein [Phlyctochytrium arcticum]